jgi:DNA-binding IclR family transcriptional regulator
MHTKDGIRSLRRGLKLLEATVEGDVKPGELATVIGVDRTTAFRLLNTLVIEGYVTQDPQTKCFRANPAKLFLMSNKLAQSLDWLQQAGEYLKELRDTTGETANLAMLTDRVVVYVGQEASRNDLSVRIVPGTRRDIHCSAVGKALVAFMEEADLEDVLAASGFPRLTAHTITSLEEFRQDLARTRTRGYAIDDQETVEGVRCVAAPVMDSDGNVLASVGVTGPAIRITQERVHELGETTRQLAERLSLLTGRSH